MTDRGRKKIGYGNAPHQGFGSGFCFQISLDPDPVSVRVPEQKRVQKGYLLEENLKFMTKVRQKIKKETISYQKSSKNI